MYIQVLVATMHQKDYTLLDNLNLQSDAVIVNQCDREERISFKYCDYNILWINSKERGLSRSRNMALLNASAEVCVICDDDERLSNGYPKLIQNAYDSISNADLIIFNIEREGWNEKEKLFLSAKKIRKYKTYGSVHITFKRKSINQRKIHFNTDFGAGSGKYTSAEDAIFCMECHRSNLSMYTYPGILCSVSCEESTWFSGYNEKYFFDVGAYLSLIFPKTKHLLKWYYPIRVRKLSHLSCRQIISSINDGINGYKEGLNYNSYCLRKK